MMQLIIKVAGTILVLIALADIYLTVLHPRAESSLLSTSVARGVWWVFRFVARQLPKRGEKLLSYSGPTIIVVIITLWILLMLIGFALIVWPALGSAVRLEQGETPTDFATAIYYAGYSLATLGTGDITPQTGGYRLLIILKSILGFSVFTLTLSYVTSVYSNLTTRNTFALSLHHRTADTADSLELLARLAADNRVDTLHQDMAEIAQHLTRLLESNNSYPVLFHFRYRQTYYALPRILYLTMDLATLTQSALNPKQYRSITHSSGAAELWFGGMHLLEEVCKTLMPRVKVPSQKPYEDRWRSHYYRALERLQAEGIEIVTDPEAGAERYVALRHQWAANLAKLIKYMGYSTCDICPAEF